MSNKHKHYKVNRQAEIIQANQTIAKNVAEALNVHYQGHAWAVNANVEQGIVVIYNFNLSQEMGFLLHLDDLVGDPSMRLVIRSGGEFLERYSLKRGTFNPEDLFNKPIDLRGNVIPS